MQIYGESRRLAPRGTNDLKGPQRRKGSKAPATRRHHNLYWDFPVKSEFWRWRVSLRSAKRPQPIISEPFSNNREVETKKWRRKVENEVRWGGPPDKWRTGIFPNTVCVRERTKHQLLGAYLIRCRDFPWSMGNRWSLYTEVSSGSWKRERRLISHIGVDDDVVIEVRRNR